MNFEISENPQKNDIALVPPLKWAGGKRWFVANHQNLLPEKFNKYIEPFLGSGAVFFSIKPSSALISDLNPELINLYEIIRDEPGALLAKLKEHQRHHSTEYFYKIRALQTRNKITSAARTLYLNRTCWNGLYRVNLEGNFNVPKGTKDNVVLATDDFQRLSEVLHFAEIKSQDFEISIDSAVEGDFIFVDPPYTVAHNNNGFVKYNQNLFKWEDQIRLRDALKRAVYRGANILVTNAAHKSVIDIYKDFEQIIVNRAGVIAASAAARGKFQELVVKNY
ncbi:MULTISPECIES: DNA adenine methylase [Delftia]|uniref:DNA adenine methylase n=1 Tax=Delftia TaxID=80865 RepID=UPI000F835F0D|nr:Dam family site-specific DNA-(adenine-N6)-methyltransferase [Delftia acidovorans]